MHRLLCALLAAVLAQSATPTFDVVSIKRNLSGNPGAAFGTVPGAAYSMTNGFVTSLLSRAFRPENGEMVGLPDWARTERFDVVARAAGTPTRDAIEAMMRGLLTERFRLAAHLEPRTAPIYNLVVANPGRPLPAALKPSALDCDVIIAAFTSPNPTAAAQFLPLANGASPCGFRMGGGVMASGGLLMSEFVAQLAGSAGRVVRDRTGLTGRYEFTLTSSGASPGTGVGDPPDIFTALQEQLGLRLEPDRAPLDTLIVDHIERPTEN